MTAPRSTNSKHEPLQRGLRIALVEPDERLHASVHDALVPWQLISYTCPHSALECLPALNPPPDVVLMATDLPGLSGAECLRKLKSAAPQLRVVMLSACAEAATILESVRAGAWGFLVRPVSRDGLREVVEGTAAGQRTFGSEAQGALANLIQRLGVSGRAQKLNPREREIMQLVAQGCQNKGIAETLNISPKTVSTHISRACKKLDVSTRLEALNEFLGGGTSPL